MRILIIKLTSLGDVIHTFPAVTDAINNVPGLEVDWMVEESFQSLLAWHNGVANVYPVATRRWRKQPSRFISEIRSLKRRLSAHQYDLIIDAQGLLKSAILARLARGKKVGYDRDSIKEQLASKFYQQSYAVSKELHAIHRTRELFAQAMAYTVPQSLDYGLDLQQFMRPSGSIGSESSRSDSDYVVFLHGTTWETKKWPIEYWQTLIKQAASQSLQVKLLWGDQSEYSIAQQLAKANHNAQVCPKLNLTEVAQLLVNSKGVVAVDTGLGHLAAALSVPCLSLYGATNSLRTGTIGQYQKHLQADFVCSPCLLKKCSYQQQSSAKPACFTVLQPDFVWQNFQQLISE